MSNYPAESKFPTRGESKANFLGIFSLVYTGSSQCAVQISLVCGLWPGRVGWTCLQGRTQAPNPLLYPAPGDGVETSAAVLATVSAEDPLSSSARGEAKEARLT